MILDSSVDRPEIMMIYFKIVRYNVLGDHLLDNSAYPFDCTFFKLIYLMAKALRRTTMRSFLVGATEFEKRTVKRVQLRILG